MKVRRRLIFSFLLPASALYLAFFLIPAVWAFYFSAFDWSGFTKQMRFIGLDNYFQLAKDPIFWKSLLGFMKGDLLLVNRSGWLCQGGSP